MAALEIVAGVFVVVVVVDVVVVVVAASVRDFR